MKRALLIAALVVAAGFGCVTASRAASTTVPSCPGHAPKPVSQGLITKKFVRPGAIAMRLCRYYGINWGDSQGLRDQRLIHTGLTIRSITHTFNRLHDPPRGIFCMRDDASELLVVFGYPNTGAELVVVMLTGCRFALNGRSTRWSTRPLQHRLASLVKSG